MKKIKTLLVTVISAASIILLSTTAKAAPYENEKFSFQQPDKSLVDVVSTGDEFFQHTESPDGYTLIRNEEGWICYAELNEDGDKLVATDTVYTGSSEVPSNLEKHIEVTQESIDKQVDENRKKLDDKKVNTKNSSLLKAKAASGLSSEIKGLTVMVDFPDEPGIMTKSQVSDYFNKVGYNTYGNRGSVHDFFYDVSGGLINYTNTVIGYYRAQHKKGDYDDKGLDCADAAGLLIKEIEQWIKDKNIDISSAKDSNGNIKILNILYAGSRNAGWDKGLWPHRFGNTFMGKSTQYQITDMTNELKLGTVCHETGHALFNYPDMYRYYNDAGDKEAGPSLVGNYCLMGSGGYKQDGKNPTPPNPYLRYVVSKFPNRVKELNSVSTNSLLTLNSSDSGAAWVYRWRNTSNTTEYYLLENIQDSGRYEGIGESGIVIWHINTDGSNKKPINQKYLVSIVEADGKEELLDGTMSHTDFFNSNNKININETTAPNAKWYDGSYSNLNLNSVSYSNASMTFKVGPGIKGFFETRGHKYFIDNYGEKATGWGLVGSGDWYYFDKDTGEAYKGWNMLSGRKYYFDNNGVYKKELCDIDVSGSYTTVSTGEVRQQAKLNSRLRLSVTPIGGNANCEFSFNVSYKAASVPSENFGPYSANDNSISRNFYFTPNHTGICAINIKVKEGEKTVTKTLYINVVQ